MEDRTWGGIRQLSGSAVRVLLLVIEVSQQGKQHFIGRLVLGVHLEHRTLKILYGVGLAIHLAPLLHLLGYRVALLRKTSMSVPVFKERALHGLTGLRKGTRVILG